MIRIAARLAAFLALSVTAAAAQTLPQSTTDRQTIAQLQYELTQPGVNAQQRLAIREQISELRYQINTRPLIAPPPGAPSPVPLLAPFGAGAAFSSAPLVQGAFPLPHVYYGSCDGDRSAFAYEKAELKNPQLTQEERGYVSDRLRQLSTEMRERRC